MPFPNKFSCTSEDYWNLPDGERAELIKGQLYMMAPPSRIHQKISQALCRIIGNYIEGQNGSCEVYASPFAVNLNADDSTYVEPDISVICDTSKLTERGCSGAPDWVIEIVSPASRKMDYTTKNALYSDAGVREYWIVDPMKQRTMVYHYEQDVTPAIYTFTDSIPVGIYPDFNICISKFLAGE